VKDLAVVKIKQPPIQPNVLLQLIKLQLI